MTIIYILLVLLIVTRFSGEVAVRLGQPALLGELLSGIVLGVLVHHFDTTFPVLSQLTDNEVFVALTELGIFFLMLLGGIELQPTRFVKSSRSSFLVAAGGMVLPLLLGLGLAYLVLPDSGLLHAQALFLGTAMAVTAVPVSIKALMDIGKLDSKVGETIVSAAVIDDTLSLILLAVLTSFLSSGGMPDGQVLLWLGSKIALFFFIAFLLGTYLFPKLGKLLKKSQAEEFDFSMLLIAALAYALLAEKLGMHFILGAFMAGLFFRRNTISSDIYEAILDRTRGLTNGFLAPIFFASIGMHLNLVALREIPLFVIALIVLATIGKLVGAGVSARISGMSSRDSLAIGAGMNARGAVEIIIADIALRAGIFSQPEPVPAIISYMFSAVVIMAIVATLVTPPALKFALKGT